MTNKLVRSRKPTKEVKAAWQNRCIYSKNWLKRISKVSIFIYFLYFISNKKEHALVPADDEEENEYNMMATKDQEAAILLDSKIKSNLHLLEGKLLALETNFTSLINLSKKLFTSK